MDTKKIEKLNACSEGIEWAAQQDNEEQAWRDCERGDWMLWLLEKKSGKVGSKSRKKLVLTACECARLSLHLVPYDNDKPRISIETAEKYARDEDGVGIKNVRKAAYDAADATAAAAAYTASYAATASYTASYVAAAAYTASYVSAGAGVAAAVAVAANAQKETLSKCANIVRKYYPKPPKF